MVDTRSKPYECDANWKGSRHAGDTDWVYTLSNQDLKDLESGLIHLKNSRVAKKEIRPAHFPVGNFADTLADLLEEIQNGRGFVLIRGLPVKDLGEENSTLMYLGIGAHLGEIVAQNMMGDILGHVRAIEGDWNENYNIRGYQTTVHLPFHCDKSDIVGLLCLETAKAGGTSNISSSVAIHNKILGSRPDLLKTLYQPFYIDHRGEEFSGDDPFYIAPVFTIHNGRFFARFGQKYVESAQRFEQVPRLTDLQVEAMELFSTLALSDEFRLDMTFQRGDIQLLNNHLVVHSRTNYQDYPEPERRRHLLRMLLFTAGYQDIPPSTQIFNNFIKRWGAEPRQSSLGNA
ncbi:MAG: TauD/TfdA family dioxygenase [Pseudomonadota bacterium]|nr:TauD/TfdA family dioxygenase [Pseudomonadota bacterium]